MASQDSARQKTDSRQLVQPFNSIPGETSQTTRQLSSARSFTDLQFLFGVQDPNMLAPKPNRNRKKSNQSSEQTKHRRTRSGCYTCRNRRVKCDENHPICERCKKGGRDCVYPEVSTSNKPAIGGSSKAAQASTRESPDSSSDEYEEEISSERPPLESIPDGDENLGAAQNIGTRSKSITQQIIGKSTTRQSSETPSLVQDKGASPTPSTEGSVGYPSLQTVGSSRIQKQSTSSSTTSDNLRTDWSHLPPDLQLYLTYFYENLTYLHYSMKFDSGNFLKTLFLDAALRNEALLYAVVGFSAFQRTLHNPEGKIQDFLQYYNKAVSLLLKSLRKGERHNEGTILAILQLATIEEFLGDWINLLGHQKAAYQILTELYTPNTIMESEMTRVILGWYMRFDAFASLMGGFEMVLDRQWLSYAQEFFQQQVAREPDNLNWKIELAIAQLRFIAMDMSTVFAKNGKGEITHEQFAEENEAIEGRIKSWKTGMDPALQDSRYLITDFNGAPALDPNDIVNPFIPGTIYGGALWVMNQCTLDWHSISLMHQYQTSLMMKTQPSREIGLTAYASCQLFEAVEFWPESPPGTVLALQASLGIACLFLPRDERHSMWARRKLAKIEAHGYIYPYTFRTKMADLFRDRSCMHWWLPNDEGFSPIIRSIRRFVEERTSPATDLPGEDLRDMKQIFSSMNLDDGSSTLHSNEEKTKGTLPEVTVAGGQDGWHTSSIESGNTQDLGTLNTGEDGAYGFWSADQSDSIYRLPDTRFP